MDVMAADAIEMKGTNPIRFASPCLYFSGQYNLVWKVKMENS